MNQLHLTIGVHADPPPQPRGPIGDVQPVHKTSEARRAYLRRYYEANKDRAREYQRRYNLMHKKKARMVGGARGGRRQEIRETFNASDIMRSPTEKSLRIIQSILRGDRYFTM
ncbi:MAG: hypothetical protein AB1483_11970 [Candidatus Zixiibacteriota bacterium]